MPHITPKIAEKIIREQLKLPQAYDERIFRPEEYDIDDKEKTFQKEIDASHPMRTKKDHDTYALAVELVSQRHGKYDLVNLVNWLLLQTNVVKESNNERD